MLMKMWFCHQIRMKHIMAGLKVAILSVGDTIVRASDL